MKTILASLTAALLAACPVHADSHHGSHGNFGRYGGGGYGRHGGGYRHGGGGRFYYYGGLPYFYPLSSFGYGDPFWYGGYAIGEPDAFYAGGVRPYEGRIVDETSPARLKAMKNGRSLPALVQRRLAENDYYKGSIDGQFGPASKSALQKYQKEHRLKPTGMIDDPTLKSLGFGDR